MDVVSPSGTPLQVDGWARRKVTPHDPPARNDRRQDGPVRSDWI
jgi:hypothetical protein